jgi:integrase
MKGLIVVENNFIDGDGDKTPKKDSFGIIPLDLSLEIVLWELNELAEGLGLDGPEDYVLMNPADPKKPTSKSVLRSGWLRALRLIGISKEKQEARHLVYHGTRHRFATKLVDSGMAPLEAMKLTRHRTLEMLMLYSDHVLKGTGDVREGKKGDKLEINQGPRMGLYCYLEVGD